MRPSASVFPWIKSVTVFWIAWITLMSRTARVSPLRPQSAPVVAVTSSSVTTETASCKSRHVTAITTAGTGRTRFLVVSMSGRGGGGRWGREQ